MVNSEAKEKFVGTSRTLRLNGAWTWLQVQSAHPRNGENL